MAVTIDGSAGITVPTLTTTTISDGTNSTSSTNCIQGSAKAWVNFIGGSATIRVSYNVSSITRNGTGVYTINFATAMPDTNYAVVGLSRRGNTDNNSQVYLPLNGAYSTTQCQVFTGATAQAGTGLDSDIVNIIFFR